MAKRLPFLLLILIALASTAGAESLRVGLLVFGDDAPTTCSVAHHIRLGAEKRDIRGIVVPASRTDYFETTFAAARRYGLVPYVLLEGRGSLLLPEDVRTMNAGDEGFEIVELKVTAVPAMHVGELRAIATNAGNNRRRGRVIAIIRDSDGNPVEGAKVTGHFSEPFEEVISAVSAANGRATLITGLAVKLSFKYEFCVQEITHDEFYHDEDADAGKCESFKYDMPQWQE